MFVKVFWKTSLFAFSVFMLLLVMGFGQGDYSQAKNWGLFSGQAKVAKPGARVSGFRSVEAAADPDIGFFDTVRMTLEEWVGGGEMASASKGPARGTELQKLQGRTERERGKLATVNMIEK